MNKEEIENYKKEYENMSLCDLADELVEPLFTVKKELAKTIYIHYAEERDNNYKLQQENKQLKEVIDRAIKYINDNLIISSILDGKKDYTINNYSFDYRELLDILEGIE